MRKLIVGLIATVMLMATPTAAFGHHREDHNPPGAQKHAPPAEPDCEIEVDALMICLPPPS